jgi:SNF2 family DNA or RNA helicase
MTLNSEPLTLYPHQEVAVSFLAATKGGGLFDDMGLGKTASAIRAARSLPADHGRIIVVVPTVVLRNWEREIHAWWPEARVQVVSRGATTVDRTARVVVVTQGLLLNDSLLSQLRALRWDVCVADEAHGYRNPKAKRTQRLLARRPGVASLAPVCARLWALTGTPMVNNPTDVWTLLASLAPERLRDEAGKSMSWHAWRARFCELAPTSYGDGWKIVGVKNTTELRQRLKGFGLRRLKGEVLDLPALRWGTVSVAASPEALAPLRALEAEVAPAVMQRVREARDPEAVLAALRDGDQFSRWRRACGMAKAPAAVELLDAELEADPQHCVVVFCHHREVASALATGLAKFGVALVTGDVSATQRQAAVDAFQAGAVRVAVCQLVAGGVGITLTRAADVVFAEQSWVPGENRQAADRCHRIGQTRSVLARTLVLADSIDEIVAEVVARKSAMISAAMP